MLGLGFSLDVSGWRLSLSHPVLTLLLAAQALDAGVDATVMGGSGTKKLRRTNGATGVQTLVDTFSAGGSQTISDTF